MTFDLIPSLFSATPEEHCKAKIFLNILYSDASLLSATARSTPELRTIPMIAGSC